MRIGAIRKTPEDRRDYDVDFSDWTPEGDEVIDAEAFLEGNSSVVIDSVAIEGNVVKVWLSGGEDGEGDEIEVRVTTNLGRIKTACFRVRINDC